VGGPDTDNLVGGTGNDLLEGRGGVDRDAGIIIPQCNQTPIKYDGGLSGDAGNDSLDGGAGLDSFDAGSGDDELLALDATAEPVLCGPDTDSFVADTTDTLSDCETNADPDGDGLAARVDNCPAAANTNQADIDADGIGDDCDPTDDRPVPLPDPPPATDTEARCTVPKLQRGSRLPAVKRRLVAAGCAAGRVSRKPSSRVQRGRLIRLKSRSTTVLAAGTPVAIVVSSGRR
jgi:hypothetical protein